MILELIATGLLAYGVAYSKTNVNNGHISDHYNESNEVALIKTQPFNASESYRIQGIYNFVTHFDYSDLPDNYNFDYDIIFDDSNLFTCSLSNQDSLYFINSLYITLNEIQADLTFYCYKNNDESTYTLTITEIYDDTYLSDSNTYVYTFRDLFFNINDPVYLTSDEYIAFSHLFTLEDNPYVVSYNGYYNFLNNPAILSTDPVNILGYVVFNNQMSSAMYFYGADGAQYVNKVDLVVWSVASNQKTVVTRWFVDVWQSNNIYFNGVKMSAKSYSTLTNVGVFSYIQDVEPSDFKDLLFTVMDTPIYFFTCLFNFEFLGVNLYVALSGLITLAIVVIIIRKIW